MYLISCAMLGQYHVQAPVAVLPEVWYMKVVGRNSNDQDMCTWYLGCTVAPCNICGMIICTYGIVFMYNFTWSFYMLCTLSEMTNKRWTIIYYSLTIHFEHRCIWSEVTMLGKRIPQSHRHRFYNFIHLETYIIHNVCFKMYKITWICLVDHVITYLDRDAIAADNINIIWDNWNYWILNAFWIFLWCWFGYIHSHSGKPTMIKLVCLKINSRIVAPTENVFQSYWIRNKRHIDIS